jgi:transcriptional regulator with XRE-family HTH domain
MRRDDVPQICPVVTRYTRASVSICSHRNLEPLPVSRRLSVGALMPDLTAKSLSVRPAAVLSARRRTPISTAPSSERLAMPDSISEGENQVKDDVAITVGEFHTVEEDAGQNAAPMEPQRGIPILLTRAWFDQLARAMTRRGWNQAQLAAATGLSGPTIHRMMKNEATTVTVTKVSKVMGIDDPVEQLRDPELQLWVYIGLRMRDVDAATFKDLLAALQARLFPADDLKSMINRMRPKDK